MSRVICPEPGIQMTVGSITFGQAVEVANKVALAGIKAGQEIELQTSAALVAKVEELERDCLTLALRLYGEDWNTFAPETRECMERLRPRVRALLEQTP